MFVASFVFFRIHGNVTYVVVNQGEGLVSKLAILDHLKFSLPDYLYIWIAYNFYFVSWQRRFLKYFLGLIKLYLIV